MRLIDADALIQTLNGKKILYNADINEAILNSPTVEERKKGKWIEITLSNHSYKCSVCGRLLVNITDGKNNVTKNYPYCHCGADMREVKE